MRIYDEPIEVRRGLVAGQEAPEQFIWRDRLWVVRDIISHWVETGAWWEQSGIAALLGVGADSTGSADSTDSATRMMGSAGEGQQVDDSIRLGADLLGERDVWRVEAMDGMQRRSRAARLNEDTRPAGDGLDLDRGYGVFDLAFDWTEARWQLLRCMD